MSAHTDQAVEKFAKRIAQARQRFLEATNGQLNNRAWLAFYARKMVAHRQLLKSVPQVAEIKDFWRPVQSLEPHLFAAWIRVEIARSSEERFCLDCKVPVKWPRKLCLPCAAFRRGEVVDEVAKGMGKRRRKRR